MVVDHTDTIGRLRSAFLGPKKGNKIKIQKKKVDYTISAVSRGDSYLCYAQCYRHDLLDVCASDIAAINASIS